MLKKILIFFNGKETISLLNYFFLLNENKIIFWKDDFGFKKKNYPFTLSLRWQKLPYIYNNFFYYNNLRIIFLNYRNIEKSPIFLGKA